MRSVAEYDAIIWKSKLCEPYGLMTAQKTIKRFTQNFELIIIRAAQVQKVTQHSVKSESFLVSNQQRLSIIDIKIIGSIQNRLNKAGNYSKRSSEFMRYCGSKLFLILSRNL